MKYIFLKPNNPFEPWHPLNGLLNIPESAGVYIWGYWVDLNINVKRNRKFCPINVGETQNLRRRLINDHYFGNLVCQQKKKRLKGEKEIFNFSSVMSQSDIQNLYSAAAFYDNRKPKNCTLSGAYCNCFFCDQTQHKNMLIYYQHLFSLGRALQINTKLLKASNGDDIYLFDLIEQLYLKCPQNLKSYLNLLVTHQKFHRENFYCIYIETNDLNRKQRKELEIEIKYLLFDELGIATTAEGTRKRPQYFPNYFDLSSIRSELITLATGKSKGYVNRSGYYHSNNNLIIPQKPNYSVE